MSKFSKADFHVHSSFSLDSMTHMFEMCEAAIARGLTSVCFTEHVEFDPADFGYGFFDYDRYRAGIQEARARYGHILRIGMGAEVSFTSKKVDEIRDFLANHEFDFVLGSLHMIDELFIGGDEYFEGRTEEEVYAPYWAELAAMASSGLFKRIGHLDYLKQAHPPTWGPFSFEHWQDHIARALEAILASGATIEVNTSGIRKGLGEPFPSWEIIELYKALGGVSVTMGSDAHRPWHVAGYFDIVGARLEQMGLAVLGPETLSPGFDQ
ncbi:MAG: histidinol-phosphatase HisJ family protein [Bacillota bacterium]